MRNKYNSMIFIIGVSLLLQSGKPLNKYKIDTEGVFYRVYSERIERIKENRICVIENRAIPTSYTIDLDNLTEIETEVDNNVELIETMTEPTIEPEQPKRQSKEYSVGNHSTFKSYMDKNKVTNKQSQQYKLLRRAEIDYDTGIYTIDGKYCIAMGSGFGVKVGDDVDLVMKNGSTVECIISDLKADKDTDSSNRYHLCDNSIVEFVVSTKSLPKKAKQMGDISYADESLKGQIKTVKVYKE